MSPATGPEGATIQEERDTHVTHSSAPPTTSSGVGRVDIDDEPWVEFVDPHGRLRTPAKVLSPTDPCILLVKFEADVHVDPHSHPFDTLYIPLQGEVNFNDPGESPLRPGQLRWVRAGHVYGPEIGGPDGAEVLVIGMKGVISIDWDAEASPTDHSPS